MKINLKSAQLAFFLNIIYIVSRGISASVKIIPLIIPQGLQYFLLFLSELSFVAIIIFLIGSLRHWQAKSTALWLTIYLALSVISFFIPIAYHTGLLTLTASTSFIPAIPVFATFATIIIMMMTSFKITPSSLGAAFRAFFIVVILSALISHYLPTLMPVVQTPTMNKLSIAAVELVSLLPGFAIFFILQKVWLLLNEGVIVNKKV
ncbi:hypothetical protein IM792_17790 [Mucilaginibacter sp. JRF]|uniref:hypothetical protein n=1 Tax=Mucilaginibacter sp. JRF TaxID=2780088 RepID=UPI00187E425A|nr:hypothetical protein [Mucilaginibacter sp. JRF]MBE9586309.1 hypothetical protein [Mucilaginibacter sp. JRF]